MTISDFVARAAGRRHGVTARLVVATTLATALRAGPVRAGPPSGESSPELLLFEDTPVTAAAKHAQSSRDAPARVTVVTREQIQRFGYRTLAEILRAVPGFYVSNDRNYDQVGVRGFLRPNDFNDRILLLVNGHAYNNDFYQQAYFGQDFGVDLEAVDHVEIIRGPGSALYGGNAFFAVINVVTMTAHDLPGVHALAETGSFGRKRGQVSIGELTDGGTELFATGSVIDVDGATDLFYPAYDDPATHHGVAHDADGERALKFFASLRSGGFAFQAGTAWREKHVPTAAYFTTFDDAGTKTVDARHFAEATYETELGAKIGFTGRVYFDGASYHGTYVAGAGRTRSKNQDLAHSYWGGGEFQFRRDLFHGNSLTAGVEYTHHPRAVQENFDLPSGRRHLLDVRSFGTLGLYLQDEWQITSRVSLVTGVRWDRYYDRLQQVSPRLGAVWTPARHTTLKLLVGRAFRPPNLYEQYYAYPAAGVRSLANPRLDAEHVTTYELVGEQDLWDGARGTLAAYHYDIDGLIEQTQRRTAGFDGVTLQYRNTGSAAANGLEAEVQTALPHGASAQASYSLQEARDASGRLLSNSPKHLGRIGVTTPLGSRLDVGAELVLVGPRQNGEGRRLEAVHLMNVSFTYRPPIAGMTVSAGIYNLLDQKYPEPGGPQLLQDRIPQDGITFRVQLGFTF